MKEARKMKASIFLDLDGVLADFDRHAREQGKFDDKGTPKWDALDHKWWETIPVFEGAREFYKAAKALGVTKFLTAPTLNKDSFSGKVDWIQSFLPERGKFALLDLIFAPAKDKQFLAGPDRILVDDREKNIKEWEEAGGIGILHKGDFANTLRRLTEAVQQVENQPVLQNLKPLFDAPARRKGTTSDRIKEFLTLQEGSVKDWKRLPKRKNAEKQWVRVFENRKTGARIEATEFADQKFYFRILEQAGQAAPAPAPQKNKKSPKHG